MSLLKIYSANSAKIKEVIVDGDAISTTLSRVGVRFERWQATQPLSADAGQDEVISAYRSAIDELMHTYSFESVDVIALGPDHPDKDALRAKFLDEHTHSDFEVRFFVDGCGLFYLHVENKVYGLMCKAGDLISVPAACPHWFDMGAAPSFKCIRLFTTPEGWVAEYTGDDIAKRFPRFDQF